MKIKIGDIEVEAISSWKMEVKPQLIDHFHYLKGRTVVNVVTVDKETVKIIFDDGAYLQLQGEVV